MRDHLLLAQKAQESELEQDALDDAAAVKANEEAA
jgi:hypothetical protein